MRRCQDDPSLTAKHIEATGKRVKALRYTYLETHCRLRRRAVTNTGTAINPNTSRGSVPCPETRCNATDVGALTTVLTGPWNVLMPLTSMSSSL